MVPMQSGRLNGMAAGLSIAESGSIASHENDYIYMPRNDFEVNAVGNGYLKISEFLSISGAIVSCYVRITCASEDKAQTCYNRKAFSSINVQIVCQANLKFLTIVAWLPGSTHDARILKNSSVKRQIEKSVFGNDFLL